MWRIWALTPGALQGTQLPEASALLFPWCLMGPDLSFFLAECKVVLETQRRGTGLGDSISPPHASEKVDLNCDLVSENPLAAKSKQRLFQGSPI